MVDPAQRTADYLRHMLEAIGRIRRYTAGIDRAGFGSQTLIQDAVIRNIETRHRQRMGGGQRRTVSLQDGDRCNGRR